MRLRALGLGIPDPRLHANAHADTARQLPCICSPAAPAAAARARRLDTRDRLLLFTSELSGRGADPPRSRVHAVVRGRGCGSLRLDEGADGRAVEVARDPVAGCQPIRRQGRCGHEVAAWRQHAIWARARACRGGSARTWSPRSLNRWTRASRAAATRCTARRCVPSSSSRALAGTLSCAEEPIGSAVTTNRYQRMQHELAGRVRAVAETHGIAGGRTWRQGGRRASDEDHGRPRRPCTCYAHLLLYRYSNPQPSPPGQGKLRKPKRAARRHRTRTAITAR